MNQEQIITNLIKEIRRIKWTENHNPVAIKKAFQQLWELEKEVKKWIKENKKELWLEIKETLESNEQNNHD